MAQFIADFHIHSKYSRATSQEMDIPHLDRYARMKGIQLLGTADFTHPEWLRDLKENLEDCGNGLYKHGETHFILSAEVCNNFRKNHKGKRIHNIIFAPSFEIVDKINSELARFGKLASDGRPNLALPAKDLVKIILDISSDCMVVPAHAWTPWFSLFGANAGFDSIEECFEEETEHIYAIETGLSSDPAMNWRLSELDRFALISNSDSHSPSRIGREANVFDTELDYYEIMRAIKNKDKERFLFTVEFFPQEGKYHYDGHRKCNVRLSPGESIQNYDICPICGRKLTIGVMHRVETLADRPEGFVPEGAIPGVHLVPLEEIIAGALQKGVGTKAVEDLYSKLIDRLGTEFDILLNLSQDELVDGTPDRVLEGIMRVRQERIKAVPGYDGVYGEIHIFDETDEAEETQMSLF
ncbi:MAG: DNA helicase UvrD [Gemmatimonadota bacterium]|nr:MAG: DNA helicase UvrD [Gemmatimonadota bacterium]